MGRKTLILAALCLPGLASATILNASITVDDDYEAYIATVDAAQGTLFMENTGTWQSVESGSVALTPGVVNYLHIQGRDVFGPPSMFIGSFSLSDGLFRFSNGLQTLDTNAVNWRLSRTGFGLNDLTPTDIGPNGSGAWGLVGGGVSPSARHIWSDTQGQQGVDHYFTTVLTPVPEPGTLVLLAIGAALSVLRRKRNA
jgi:hypothetical protein